MKHLLIKAQNWYQPEKCNDCPGLIIISVDNGCIGYCKRMEKEEKCNVDIG